MAAVLDWKSCQNAYADINLPHHSVDWLLLGYKEGSKNRIGLLKKGEGQLSEMSKYLTEEMVAFGYMKIRDAAQEGSPEDADFIHITFIGKYVKAQERARAVIHRLDVQQALPRYIIEFEAKSKDDLQMERVYEEIAAMKEQLVS
jgi:hypothetical protein